MKEHKDKLSADDVKKVEAALEAAKKALSEDNAEKIKSTMEELQQAAFKIGEAMYKAASGTPPAGDPQAGAGDSGPTADESAKATSGGAPKKDENVVDAEFEETK